MRPFVAQWTIIGRIYLQVRAYAVAVIVHRGPELALRLHCKLCVVTFKEVFQLFKRVSHDNTQTAYCPFLKWM